MRRAQSRVAHASPVERPLEARDRVRVAREDRGLRPVDRGDRQAVAGERPRVVFRKQHGEHRAARRAAHQPAPQRDQRRRVVDGEDAGEAGGDVFADAVAEKGRRSDAGRHRQPGERVLDREERRLRVFGPAKTVVRSWIRAEDELDEIDVERRPHGVRAAIERGAIRGKRS